ncbi:hypothetical protein GLOTRDRAFT_131658 [Gloeophyllum trabeum ATCC 11539]|uniref:F-box domain-containing protein n=1 Tax=Gloeophyllum trabeum (strain ATCC 11539 / FP-39264 / Madison 617) TaxID=670483 RepID=S7PXS9_GLOTA|nr:uncharacterized protein GLOTRDRAFT_131658 [Gloeophyllum trabeum ATCC 11539]EPQ52416.1 hypothetical protein GLOTRDRAFT_131658 [Gloeophyllum trabeum ATCC 11539]
MSHSIMPRTNFSNLSYELISKIVEFGTGDGTDPATGAIVPPSATGLLAATHVCRSWREATVHNATHWRNIWMGSLDSVRTMLARTLRLPVAIAGSLSTAADGRKLAVVMNQISRVRSLTLRATSEALRALDGRRKGEASILETLEIERVDREERVDLSCFVSPKLRHLDITNFDFDEFRPLLSPSMTSLRISGACVSTRTGEVLQLLHHLPHLESLELKVNLLPTAEEGALVQTTCLGALRRLDLGIQSIGEAELLAFVSMPHLDFIRLSIFCDDDLPEIMELVRRRFEVDGRTAFGRCTFYAPNPTSLHVELTPNESVPASLPQVGTYLVFDNFEEWDEYRVIDLLRTKFGPTRTAPWMSAVEHLSIRNARAHTEISTQSWKTLFKTMPRIKTLHILERGVSVFPTGFYSQKSVGNLWYRRPLFPELESLDLEGVWFRASSRLPEQDQGDFLDRLIRPYQRCDVTQNLKNLTIRAGVNIFHADIELLRKISRDVHWDGVESFRARNDTFEEGIDFDLYDAEDDEAGLEDRELEDGELEEEEVEDEEFEDAGFEDSEFEDSEFEDSEFEDSELEDGELEDGEPEDGELDEEEPEAGELEDGEIEDGEQSSSEDEHDGEITALSERERREAPPGAKGKDGVSSKPTSSTESKEK